jgi:F0F1-type ATP synthase delta subunit
MYAKALAHILIKGNISHELIFSFLEKRKLLTLLPEIVKELQKIQKSEDLAQTLQIQTPFPLNDEAKKSIEDLVGSSHKNTKVIVQKSLLSGFTATYEGKLYDASAQRILRELIK